MEVVQLLQQGFLRMVKLPVIPVFHIVEAKDDMAVPETFVIQQIRAVNAFQQYGMIVPEQPVEELAVGPGTNDIGQPMREPFMPFMPGIVMHFHAIFVEHGLGSPSVFETVQMDLYASARKQPYLMKEVENAPIIHGIRHIQANDM